MAMATGTMSQRRWMLMVFAIARPVADNDTAGVPTTPAATYCGSCAAGRVRRGIRTKATIASQPGCRRDDSSNDCATTTSTIDAFAAYSSHHRCYRFADTNDDVLASPRGAVGVVQLATPQAASSVGATTSRRRTVVGRVPSVIDVSAVVTDVSSAESGGSEADDVINDVIDLDTTVDLRPMPSLDSPPPARAVDLFAPDNDNDDNDDNDDRELPVTTTTMSTTMLDDVDESDDTDVLLNAPVIGGFDGGEIVAPPTPRRASFDPASPRRASTTPLRSVPPTPERAASAQRRERTPHTSSRHRRRRQLNPKHRARRCARVISPT